ncbi:MAG: hypothetical protein R3D71_07975 [Rickettsiales bacterium]
MVLVDTSVWIDHFRSSNNELQSLLNECQVLSHNFIIGELSLGNFKKRNAILEYLNDFPKAIHAEDSEVANFIKKNKLFGRGIGYIDAHLLASAIITETHIWTNDKKLRNITSEFDISWK